MEFYRSCFFLFERVISSTMLGSAPCFSWSTAYSCRAVLRVNDHANPREHAETALEINWDDVV